MIKLDVTLFGMRIFGLTSIQDSGFRIQDSLVGVSTPEELFVFWTIRFDCFFKPQFDESA